MWVVVDLVGLLFLVIDKGNRYIFMLVDYLSCYLEVILLLSIEIEKVVEVLMDIFFRGGVLWEMLIDMGI